jgi:hypothetical protein
VLDAGVLVGLTPSLPSNLLHDTGSTASISGGANLGSSTIVWTEGVSTNKLDYTETGRLKGTVTLVPGAGFTFDSFSASSSFQTSLRTLFAIGGTQPTISPAPKADTPAAGVSNLVFTVDYPLSPKPASDTINAALIGTFESGVAITLKDTGVVIATDPDNFWAQGVGTDVTVTPVSVGVQEGGELADLDVDDVVTLRVTVEPKPGFVLSSLNDGQKTALASAIETAVDLAIYTAHTNSQKASSTVTFGTNSAALLQVNIAIKIDS